MENESPSGTPPEPLPVSRAARAKTNWLLFWIVLLIPTILTLISVAAGKLENDFTGYVVFYGSGVAAAICGFIAAGSFTSSLETRLLATIALGVGLYFLSVCLCFAGCVCAANSK